MPLQTSRTGDLAPLALGRNATDVIYVGDPAQPRNPRPNSRGGGRIPPTREAVGRFEDASPWSNCPAWPECLPRIACVVNEKVRMLNDLLDRLNRQYVQAGGLSGSEVQVYLGLFALQADSLEALLGLKDPASPAARIQWPLVPCASLERAVGSLAWIDKEYEFAIERSPGSEICHGRIVFTQDCTWPAAGGLGRSRGYITNFKLIGHPPVKAAASSSSSSSSSSSHRGK